MTNGMNLTGLHLIGLGELKRNWGWFLGLGIALVVLGTIALGSVGGDDHRLRLAFRVAADHRRCTRRRSCLLA